MTPKYWTRIVVGILAVFVLGVVVVRGVNGAISRVKSFASNVMPSPIRLMSSVGFKVDGDRLGDIQRLQFMRSQPGQFDSAVVTVKVDDSADVRRIASCTLRVTTENRTFDGTTKFVCVSHSDSTRLGLVPFGHIVVEPSGETVTFYAASSVIDEMRLRAYRGTGNSDTGDVDIIAKDDKFTISVDGHELVNLNGAGNNGSVVIRDAQGNPIVQLSDSGGVQIHNGSGKTVVNIHGDRKGH